jgi:hypothetical protein
MKKRMSQKLHPQNFKYLKNEMNELSIQFAFTKHDPSSTSSQSYYVTYFLKLSSFYD